MKKLVLTGAAGRLGGILREPLSKLADTLISSDIADSIDDLAPNERYVKADLSDLAAMTDLLKDADMVVHFGAIGDEAPFEQILRSNIMGAYNVWEAAHRNGLHRVVYASSVHAVGMYPKTQCLTTDTPHRPDSYYGLAKCFAEDLASLYWDKRGLESVCLRIFSCAEVTNPRAVGTWLSYPDLIQLVTRSIDTPVTGCTTVYGISDNDRAGVDNTGAKFLGYRPQDNAEQYAARIFAENERPDPQDKAHMCHGGPFATVPLGESGVALLNLKETDG